MPDFRTLPAIRERLDLEFPRLPDRARRQRRWAIAVCAVLPLLLIGWFAAAGNRRVYWARPVTTPHRFFENDCNQCHTHRWQPLVRLVTNSHTARSVDDASCRQCHGETSHDHSPQMIASRVIGCVQCHQEHNGLERLNQVADVHCVMCHGGELLTRDGPSTNFASGIDSFARHPEFALHSLMRGGAAVPGEGHGLHQRLQSPSPDGNALWSDAAAFHFHHAKHLQADGVLLPHDHPENHDGKQRKILHCGDCHQAAADGRSRQPISYQQHCRQCHPLAFTTRLAAGGPLPHAEPELVFGVMRDRLMTFAREQPAGEDGSQRDLPRVPHKTAEAEKNVKDQWEWVESQLAESGGLIFNSTKNGCALCHVVVTTVAGDDAVGAGERLAMHGGFRIVPPQIPDRWMPHSRFRHQSHAMLRCGECHAAAESQSARDVLMPSIELCRQCHGSASRTRGDGQARADCVECHEYHQHSQPSTGRPLQELLRDG